MINIGLDIDEVKSVGDVSNIQMRNSNEILSYIDSTSEQDKNIFISDQKGIFRIIEFKMNLTSKNISEARDNFYLNQAKVFKKQLLVTLNKKNSTEKETTRNTVCLNPSDMMFMDGSISVDSNLKSVSDFIGKSISGSLLGQGIIKPKYTGNGHIMLEPTYNYIILHDLGETNIETGLIISDGSFLASSGEVKISTKTISKLSASAFGKEGLINLLVKGAGVIAYTSPVPKSDIVVVELHKSSDSLKVNGNYAIAWSDTLSLTIEPVSTSLFGTAVAAEGYVHVFSGKGKVYLANVVG